jgi:hypothetical protein
MVTTNCLQGLRAVLRLFDNLQYLIVQHLSGNVDGGLKEIHSTVPNNFKISVLNSITGFVVQYSFL